MNRVNKHTTMEQEITFLIDLLLPLAVTYHLHCIPITDNDQSQVSHNLLLLSSALQYHPSISRESQSDSQPLLSLVLCAPAKTSLRTKDSVSHKILLLHPNSQAPIHSIMNDTMIQVLVNMDSTQEM